MNKSDYKVSEIRAVLASIGFQSQDIGKKTSVLSGGELIKLKLAELLLGRFNFLILDEPCNYLDTSSIEALERLMLDYQGTILFISHDRRLIDNVANYELRIVDHSIVEIS